MQERKILIEINKLISILEGIITSGSCSNFEEYRYNSGRLAAFRECIKIIKGYSENE